MIYGDVINYSHLYLSSMFVPPFSF